MILADTSVWIDHLRSGIPEMRQRLDRGQIVIHPLIIAELALGTLQDRTSTLALLDLMPQLQTAQISEIRALIENQNLYGLGIGVIDASLIASTLINPPTLLWTRDKQLRKVAENLGIHATLS
jgi:predicted nucleic acid-binding protein